MIDSCAFYGLICECRNRLQELALLSHDFSREVGLVGEGNFPLVMLADVRHR